MSKDFRDVAAKANPVYGTIFGSIGQAQGEQDTQGAQDTQSTQGRKGQKQQRINMAFTPENLDYLRVMSGLRGVSITKFVNELIAQDREKNQEAYGEAINLKDRL